MDSKSLLESMLADGKNIAEKSLDAAEEKLGVPQEGAERDATLKGMQKGALAAGALALLLGTGAGRRLTGAAIKLGSVAAVSGLAYNAYNKWQSELAQSSGGVKKIEPANQVTQLPDAEAQKRSVILIRAMVAAAKADGHVTEVEKKAMLAQVEEHQFDADTMEFLKTHISADPSVTDIAALVDTPEAAAEMYLACRSVINIANEKEKEWLDQLAGELKLSDDLVVSLEAQLA